MTTLPAQSETTAPATMRQLLIDSGYVLIGLPLGLIGFILTIVTVTLGAGLAVTVIGLPILAGGLYVARGFADLERLRLPAVLRAPYIRPAYRKAKEGSGLWGRVFAPILDTQSWLDFAHALLMLPIAAVAFAFTAVWWAGALAGVTYWAWDWALPYEPDNTDLPELLGLPDTGGSRIALYTVLGIFFLTTLPLVVRGAALLSAYTGRALLTGMAQFQTRITTLEGQRRAAVSAEAHALRRLERDIHDGPQQRLVRLAMDLGRAQQQLESDPAAARATLDEALAHTVDTLNELRALSRGIAPPVLADRGLPSALAALAGRSTVPVELAVDPELGTPAGRLDAVVENAAYFVVAEALANLNKHSNASEAWLTVAHAGGRLGISVLDNGAGGAHLAKGHGLAGLADRVQAAGGTLRIDSPMGGPTELRVDLPC
ncbi:sensor histidine kinase [Catenuloplanes atrovinosus]|uniref:histidine kinase n=1 Tax=Catenuloplanes atrovinosus TaxID=137266 RepID=A0AAE3YY42_9ACTN|nr:sensor domain-containing protein [Catenuloplanes atrovinosus]MDR7280548.1 signal transduction histidine kinase [Catenuloplanes atrovinosus]